MSFLRAVLQLLLQFTVDLVIFEFRFLASGVRCVGSVSVLIVFHFGSPAFSGFGSTGCVPQFSGSASPGSRRRFLSRILILVFVR